MTINLSDRLHLSENSAIERAFSFMRFRKPTRFDEIFEHSGARKDSKRQMLNMASSHGLTKNDLVEKEWLANWIIERCDTCPNANLCFLSLDGKPVTTAGIDGKRCPNFPIYQAIKPADG